MVKMAQSYPNLNILCVAFLLVFSIDYGSCCPTQCSCNVTSKHVFCRDTSMVGIPQTIPADTESLAITGYFGARFDEVTHLSRADLSWMPNLKELIISFSALATVDVDAFQDLEFLRQVELSNNKILFIPNGLFQNLPNMANIDLSGNANCIVASGSFANIPELHFLNLGHMNIGTLQEDDLAGLPSLKSLYLPGNNLKHFPRNLISSSPNLTVLDIADNELKTLPADLESSLKKLTLLDVSDNPWHCNCEIAWMKNLPTSPKSKIGPGVMCLSPDNLMFQNLNDIPEQDLVCVPPKITDCDGPYDVEEGSKLKITCKVIGDPIPDVTITHFGRGLIDAKHVNEEYFISIDFVSEIDDGRWNLKASNLEGLAMSNFIINVLVDPTSSTTVTSAAITTKSSTTSSSKTTSFTTPETTHSTPTSIYSTPTTDISKTIQTSDTSKTTSTTETSKTTATTETSQTTSTTKTSKTSKTTLSTPIPKTSLIPYSTRPPNKIASEPPRTLPETTGFVAVLSTDIQIKLKTEPLDKPFFDPTGVILAGVFGGGSLAAAAMFLICTLCNKFHRNSVKPFKQQPEDLFDVSVEPFGGNKPPISTAFV